MMSTIVIIVCLHTLLIHVVGCCIMLHINLTIIVKLLLVQSNSSYLGYNYVLFLSIVRHCKAL